jgi:hypothetical protein
VEMAEPPWPNLTVHARVPLSSFKLGGIGYACSAQCPERYS